MKIIDLAKTIAPNYEYEIVGIRPGEKLHEVMVPEDDARRTLEFDDYFIIEPSNDFWSERSENHSGGKSCPEGFQYSSDKNNLWLKSQELNEMLGVKEKV
jgi:UDP-N-acetylglucosamine 4,6-dehydratase